MRANYKVELTSGVFLLMGIAALLWLATEATDYGIQVGDDTYSVTARFTNVGDLKNRAPVKIGGVTVGMVDGITLDPEMFEAIVVMNIDKRFSDIPNDENLVLKAARLLQTEASSPKGAHIRLEKRLPLGAGLGGGSSNAATTLLALNKLWDCRLSQQKLAELATVKY